MLIELTASFDPGDLGSGPYTHVQIRSAGVDMVAEKITINTLYGTVALGQAFVPGIDIRNSTRIKTEVTGGDFATLMAIDNQTFLAVLYDWLVDEAVFVGDVIEEEVES